jgi:hypothetical protein
MPKSKAKQATELPARSNSQFVSLLARTPVLRPPCPRLPAQPANPLMHTADDRRRMVRRCRGICGMAARAETGEKRAPVAGAASIRPSSPGLATGRWQCAADLTGAGNRPLPVRMKAGSASQSVVRCPAPADVRCNCPPSCNARTVWARSSRLSGSSRIAVPKPRSA